MVTRRRCATGPSASSSGTIVTSGQALSKITSDGAASGCLLVDKDRRTGTAIDKLEGMSKLGKAATPQRARANVCTISSLRRCAVAGPTEMPLLKAKVVTPREGGGSACKVQALRPRRSVERTRVNPLAKAHSSMIWLFQTAGAPCKNQRGKMAHSL